MLYVLSYDLGKFVEQQLFEKLIHVKYRVLTSQICRHCEKCSLTVFAVFGDFLVQKLVVKHQICEKIVGAV